MPTIAQSAGRAYVLLLQNKDLPSNAQRALEELQHHRLELVDGEPELLDATRAEIKALQKPEKTCTYRYRGRNRMRW